MIIMHFFISTPFVQSYLERNVYTKWFDQLGSPGSGCNNQAIGTKLLAAGGVDENSFPWVDFCYFFPIQKCASKPYKHFLKGKIVTTIIFAFMKNEIEYYIFLNICKYYFVPIS